MSGETILVVDDSPTICKLVELTLTKAGYRVETARTGEGGVDAAQTCQPNLILLDYLLPDLKGDDVCRAISGNVRLAAVPVVVMSAKGEDISECFAVMPNVVNIIAKPFSPEALLAVVNHTLEKAGSEPAGPMASSGSDGRIDLVALISDEAKDESPPRPALDPSASLAGDLAVVSIADVLLLLQDRGYTGTVNLTHARAQMDIYLGQGRVDFAGAHGVAEEFLLGGFLVRGGHITQEALTQALEERRSGGGGELLGAYLCGRGLLPPASLRKAMAKQTAALVYESLRWGNGRFAFRRLNELPEMAREASLGLAVDGLILEGLRRVEEWRLIEQEIGDFDMTFVRNEDKLSSFGRGQLLREEAAIAELVNGKNTVRDLIQISNMGSYDVTQVLFRLLRSKLIRRRVAPVIV
ncbi:MAG: response regulator [Deltaproteobacteria bacterium]|nr:response regulator [Deltaproteobacteria bacterium]